MGENPLRGVREPAGMLGPRRASKRSAAARKWDRENPATSYRIDPRVVEGVRAAQAWYRDRGYEVTQGQVVEDLLTFALEAWARGEVEVNVKELEPRRRAVRREP